MNKDLALRVFLDAFDRAGIERDKTNLITSKPYHILAEKIVLENELSVTEIDRFAHYFKGKFNLVKNQLSNGYKNTITFYTDYYEPLSAYALKLTTGKATEELIVEALYSPKRYHFLNFWRMPESVKLIRNKEGFILKADNQLCIDELKSIETTSMPRDSHSNWLKIIAVIRGQGIECFYLKAKLLNNNSVSLSYLIEKIKPFVSIG